MTISTFDHLTNKNGNVFAFLSYPSLAVIFLSYFTEPTLEKLSCPYLFSLQFDPRGLCPFLLIGLFILVNTCIYPTSPPTVIIIQSVYYNPITSFIYFYYLELEVWMET
jgi:hypothetical protein